MPHRVSPRQTAHANSVSPAVDLDGELSLDELELREREIIVAALRRTGRKIYGEDGAAALFKIKPTTLVSKMKRQKIEKLSIETEGINW